MRTLLAVALALGMGCLAGCGSSNDFCAYQAEPVYPAAPASTGYSAPLPPLPPSPQIVQPVAAQSSTAAYCDPCAGV